MFEADDHQRDPRSGAEALRALSRRVLAQARREPRLSRRVRRRADRSRLSRDADPGGVRRRGADALGRRGGAGGDPARGLQRRCLPRADVHHGHRAPARQRGRRRRAICPRSPPANCGSRPSASPSRRAAPTPPRIRTFARRDGDRYVVNGQKIWTSRAEHSDLMLLLARTTPRDEVAKRTDGLSVFILDMREALGNGLTIRPIRTMMNHSTTEVFFDNVPGSGREPRRRGGQGVPLHPVGHERGAHPDRRRMRRRRQMADREGGGLRQGAQGLRPADRRRTRASSSRSPGPTPTCGRPN